MIKSKILRSTYCTFKRSLIYPIFAQVVAAGAADEGMKEVTKTGEEVVSTSEGEIQLEGGGTAKTSGTSTSKKSQQVTMPHKPDKKHMQQDTQWYAGTLTVLV